MTRLPSLRSICTSHVAGKMGTTSKIGCVPSRNSFCVTRNCELLGATRGKTWPTSDPLQRNGLRGCGGGMLNLESGVRIELFYEDAPARAIRATVSRLLTDRDEGMGTEVRSEEHTSELQSRGHLVCRLLLEKKKMRESTVK